MKSNKDTKVSILLNGNPFEVPPGGTLGILALGNVGIRAWKRAKAEWVKNSEDVKEKK
jgi:hypothetical protein